MSHFGSTEFLIEVRKGNVAGHSVVHKFGRNDAVPNGTWERIALLSIPTTYLSAPTTVRVKAGGDANDTAAGTGAREITVQGIDDNLVEVEAALATAGASASLATAASFWRPYRAWVSSTGTYGGDNAGAVTIENSAGGTDLLLIAAEEGQSQFGGLSIPTGTTGHLLSALVTVDATKAADIRFCTRENFTDTAAPVSATRIVNFWDGVLGVLPFNPKSPGGPFPALTDVWFDARGSGGVTQVSVDFEILMVDD